MDNSLRSIIFSKLPKVKGYLDTLDALVYAELSKAQARSAAAGSIVEIGVFFRRSLFLLHQLDLEAPVLGIDLFDIPAHDGYLMQKEQVIAFSRKFNFGISGDMLLTADSTRLAPDWIVDRIGPVKIFSIDGGHELHHVAKDAELASQVLTDDGVIIFDDSFNPMWPEVTVGIIDFLREQPQYATFCITDKKLYVSKADKTELYKSQLHNSIALLGFNQGKTRILGHEAITFKHAISKKISARILSSIQLDAITPYIYLGNL
jgi:Methyltransferase domain